jgi:haloacetate dehalogenase
LTLLKAFVDAGFVTRRFAVNGTNIHAAIGGSGPPLLLIHGYPQSLTMWHKLAPALAQSFTVIAADLRGYGDSDRPPSDGTHEAYSKRTMADDLVAVMFALGYQKFAVAGHDRGGRVAYRMAFDHPAAITRIAVLDIVPTKSQYDSTDRIIATHYYHWFFLIQPAPFPETLIGANPDFFLTTVLGAWSNQTNAFTPEARAEYFRAFNLPGTVAASCEDYRAGASIDCRHDAELLEAGRTINVPFLVLWGKRGLVGAKFNPIAEWQRYASDVRGDALECGHFLPEEAPAATLAALQAFFC